eukprot:SAG31_NODE_24363_length_483_cov_0.820312_1_plen_46_part_10
MFANSILALLQRRSLQRGREWHLVGSRCIASIFVQDNSWHCRSRQS